MSACASPRTDSATLHRWYENWIKNKEKVLAKYGERWYRVRFPAASCELTARGKLTHFSNLSLLSRRPPRAPPQIWLYFLASSVITSRQGGASVFQITLHKNLNGFHRVDLVNDHANIHPKLDREPS